MKPLRDTARDLRRSVYEYLGNGRYSRPSLNDLDRKLEKYLDWRGGFFVELGANDGYTQSNTYYLEKIKHWRGVLIEPIPDLYAQAVRRRRRSCVVNAACIAVDDARTHVDMTYVNLMSVVSGVFGGADAEKEYIEDGARVQQITPYVLQVPARTITSILDECHAPQIDFLSLDVEGYEPHVLRGLDMTRHRPRFILVEGLAIGEVDRVIAGHYRLIEQMSRFDYLYQSIQ